MKRPLHILIASLMIAGQVSADDELLVPAIVGPWTQIAGNPDLGELTGPNQEPVDFAVWQAADGSWQAWSCIRKTKCGGHTRLFYRWEGAGLTQPDWTPMGIALQADPALGEDTGGLQAPHVVREGGRFHMFYGDWNNICHAVSDDGKTFERVIQPTGKTAMFTQGPGVNTRDIMLLKVGDTWHGYYTAYPNDQGAVFMRTTRDYATWSESSVVSFGGLTGTGKFSSECPHVIQRHGRFYLFRTQHYGPQNITTVYHSTDPNMFGINQDDRYLATRLAVAAPEIVQHEGLDYIVALNPTLDGLRIARLKWQPPPEVGQPLFAFDDESHRRLWTIETGDLPGPFTNSTRTQFSPPQEFFVSTSELGNGRFDDRRTGSVRSPEFELTDSQYFAWVSGGDNSDLLYAAIVDSESNRELVRISSGSDSNTLQLQLIQTDQFVGRRVFVRIVDQSRDGWGHINFGGLYTAE
jgi:hypothetical protein